MTLEQKLKDFASTHKFLQKGSLSVALVLTRNVREAKFPLTSSDFITEGKGQVKGLGGDAVQKILKDHGISRLLAKEGGRTSRGSISNMEKYVHFLNQLFENGMLDLNQIEAWWVGQVRDFLPPSLSS